jgi:hypothetical protein
MPHKQADPLWTVRGLGRGVDVCMVVEAASETEADCFATKRGVEVIVVNPATAPEIAHAKRNGLLWRYTPEPRLKCFGRPVGHLQAASLVICGLATMVLNLHAHHVPLRLHW